MICSQAIFVVIAIISLVAAESYEGNPNYNFEYAVNDPVTGDQKSQAETRNGDSVQGYYQLLEPDGTYRTVNYVADPVGGFRATVSKSGSPQLKAIPAPVAIIPKPVPSPLPVIQPARYAVAPVIPKVAPAPIVAAPVVPAASYNYPYYQGYQAYPYSAYPYSSYPYNNNYYSGYYPYYSQYYNPNPYYNYKK